MRIAPLHRSYWHTLFATLVLGLVPGLSHAHPYLVDFGGQVTIERSGAPLAPTTGMNLQGGDRLQTQEEGWLLIGFTERAALHLAGQAQAQLLAQEVANASLAVRIDAGVARLATEVPFALNTPVGIVSSSWGNLVIKSQGVDAGIAVVEGDALVLHPDPSIEGVWPLTQGQWRPLYLRQTPGKAVETPMAWLAGIGPELVPCGCGDVLSHLVPGGVESQIEEEETGKKTIAPPGLRALPIDQMMQRDRPLSRPMVVPR
ncbi:MAG: hypothetical protein COX57_10975 [Alphaproteobacteria bacterium CG_4_10_14_0_2_um_filter_63_37]|nr:MAG: hypothetical protein AUJ55_09350 [Proteobacteria bacterium CG1_02_64_396]PJA23969.1 MAG: hypothetical protein COX57_10975 [Alphaproteobacteria bacterium CG_4_10_14_0_2_um_filter_63_37]